MCLTICTLESRPLSFVISNLLMSCAQPIDIFISLTSVLPATSNLDKPGTRWFLAPLAMLPQSNMEEHRRPLVQISIVWELYSTNSLPGAILPRRLFALRYHHYKINGSLIGS